MPELGPLTCAGCGLLCDDVTIADGRVHPPCALGSEWFAERLRAAAAPPATIAGEPASVDAALSRAVELLRAARRPLLYGFHTATVEDARAAVALADGLGALISVSPVAEPWAGASAVALRGASSATLGEIRDRSRLVVIWREDPERTHPRLLERLGFGSGDRTLIVVDDRDTATAARADVRLRWGRERDLEALVTLRALHHRLAGAGDLPLRALLDHIETASHLAFVHGDELARAGQRRVLALHELVRGLSGERHAVTLALTRASGITGARDALTWQSGYRGAVDFGPGYPEPVAATRPLATGVDVAVRVEGVPEPLDAAEIALGGVPGEGSAVSIRTAAAGIQASGTAHRLDGVPLTLQAPLPSDAPTAAALLNRLRAEVVG